ncbi:ExbD/TolR family protein [Pseudotabrizicola algicola]|uniref:Biopolymer transporter ExbD n=1 Tax=Pseudotabrizicola algicola TaxID=2709381 RepID=A0A6B3RJ14_9RHOB|nr:biopolymer transporter ExbD [Pseudotabrizicola algicola]NEX45401.1 hypothetical protein [Pseudotabrizicola algicola]
MFRLDRPRRRKTVSMTSLIDVIFLLLLFFMLSSTFTRFGDLPLTTAAAGTVPAPQEPPALLRLTAETMMLDTKPIAMEELPAALSARAPLQVVLAPAEGITAQRLVDVLAIVRDLRGVTLRVIGG